MARREQCDSCGLRPAPWTVWPERKLCAECWTHYRVAGHITTRPHRLRSDRKQRRKAMARAAMEGRDR